MGIIDLFREFSSTSPEEKESAERRRSNYIPTILFLLMSIRMPDEKKSSWGGEGDFRTRGIRVRVYMRMYVQRCGSVYVTRFFFFSRYVSPFSLSRRKLKKKKRNCLFLMFFFFRDNEHACIVHDNNRTASPTQKR